jgi:hypothetical protein
MTPAADGQRKPRQPKPRIVIDWSPQVNWLKKNWDYAALAFLAVPAPWFVFLLSRIRVDAAVVLGVQFGVIAIIMIFVTIGRRE